MTTTDVVEPGASDEDGQKLRCTAHLFPNAKRYELGDSRLDSGAEVRISAPHTSWPPSILFDLVYAQAVLANFGVQSLRDAFRKVWDDTYYHNHIRRDETEVQWDRTMARRLRHARARQELDLSDTILLFPVLQRPDLWPTMLGLDDVDEVEVDERINARRHEMAVERVNAWRGNL